MNPHQRTALRFAVYIRALGGDPIPFRHGTHREWALDLQRQHERLRQGVPPELAKAAKISARAIIRRKGYRLAAEEVEPMQASVTELSEPGGHFGDTERESSTASDRTTTARSADERRAIERDKHMCRRKLHHPEWWSALLHARQLGPDIRIFACEACGGGLLLGHPPDTESTQKHRRARKRLQVINRRLGSLENERMALVEEKENLLRELGKHGQAEALILWIVERIRRVLIAVALQIDSQ